MWDGVRLRCPSCGEGRIFRRWFQPYESCRVCGAPFERPGEGDFLMTMIFAYGAASLVVLITVLLLYRYTELDASAQIAITLVLGLGTVVLTYRSIKGIWITLLIALLKWER